ncbi:hypothetical protein CVT26_004129 [Gymnopilus dilepis]|uniref:NB-ARC domain-containing protein n=1 Tax=Gymnopilus dilepis TaxID=231916 RepID=A0A409YVA0_9AGAR|nr:hypothetical protein CVT26_004129 [Gymnopilus dilepis]
MSLLENAQNVSIDHSSLTVVGRDQVSSSLVLIKGLNDQTALLQVNINRSVHTAHFYHYSVGGSTEGTNQAAAGPPDVPTKDAPSPSPLFQGRRFELEKLKEYFKPRSPGEPRSRRAILLYGMGGIGKTQLSRKFAEETSDQFSYIFWIDGSTTETIALGLQNLPGVKLVSPDGSTRPILQWISGLEGEWLMLFDNAEEHIHGFVPPGNSGNILVTSRNRSVGRSTAFKTMEVEQMAEDDAVSLLLKASCLDQAPTPVALHDMARLIVDELQCLPLAVDQAGASIESGLCGINDYLQLYSSCRKRLLDDQSFKTASSYEQTVYGTWELSYKKIESISLASNISGVPFSPNEALTAIVILQVFAHLHHDNIGMEIFKAAWTKISKMDANERPIILHNHNLLQEDENGKWDELHFRNGIRVLLRFSLVKQGSSDTIYSVHPLVHSWSRDRLLLIQQQVRWQEARKFLGWSIQSLDSTTAGHRFRQHLVPHILANSQCYDWVQREDIDDHYDCRAFGQSLNEAGIWPKAEELFHKALEKCRRDLGPDHPNTLVSMTNLVSTIRHQGRFEEAEKLGVEVLNNCQRVLGMNHPDTLTSMTHLASIFWNQGRFDEAEKLGVEVFVICQMVLGSDHPNTLSCMNNLATVFQTQGRYTEAEKLEVEALTIHQRVLGPEHPDTLASMNNLALTFGCQGRFVEAQKLQMEALEICQRVLGEEHPDTLAIMGNLASTFQSQGRFARAERLQVEVLTFYQRVLGTEHPDTLTSMNNLAFTFHNQGKYADAKKLQMQVLDIRRQVLGREHPATLITMGHLASTFWEQGRYAEAEKLQVEVLDIRQRVLGQKHPATLISMGNLASIFWNQGRYAEAEKLQVEVLDIRQKVLGPEHPATLVSMINLATTFWNQGRFVEAEKIQVEVLATCQRVLGPEHPLTLDIMGSNLASIFKDQGT